MPTWRTLRTVGRLGPALTVLSVALLGAAWFLHCESSIAHQWGFSLDDSWIYATFARNVATGHGYSFNTGESIGGATGPLYVFILASFYLLFGGVIWPAKIFGIACLGASGTLIYGSVRKVVPNHPLLSWLAGILTAISPTLLWGSLSGMEIPAYLLLACLGIYFYIGERWVLSALSWSVGVWLRPDGLLLAGLGILARPRLSGRSVARSALISAAVIGGYCLFNLSVGKSLLPNSVGVKATLSGNLLAREWNIAGQWLWLWGLSIRADRYGPHAVLLVPLLLVGAVFSFRRWPALSVYPLLFPLAFGLFSSNGGQHGRYLAYVIPFGIVLGCIGLAEVSGRIPRHRRAFLVGAMIVTIGWQVLAGRLVGIAHGWNVQNINGMHRFLAESVSPGDTVAVNDVGAMGYFSGCYVVDLVGLTSPKRLFRENLSLYRPKLLIIFPDWFRDSATIDPRTGQGVFLDADSKTEYVPVAGLQLRNNTIASRNTMVIYQRLPIGQLGPRNPRLVVQ